ncbi:MAG: hypothetical protein ACI311_06395 [Bacilli bacterium]
MADLIEEHNEEEEKEFLLRQKSRRRGRTFLIVINSILCFYLCFFVGKSIFDKVTAHDDEIVSLCGMSASKSIDRYNSLFESTYDLGDYFVYGNSLNLSQDKFDILNFVPLSGLQIVSVCSASKSNETVYPLKDATKYVNEGLDLYSLDEGDYILTKDSKGIRVLSGSNQNVNTLYTLPDEQGYRKEIKVYSYSTNPCLVISVNKVKKLPKNYYDFVFVSNTQAFETLQNTYGSKFNIQLVNETEELEVVDSYNTSFVIKVEVAEDSSTNKIIDSIFVNSAFTKQIEGSGTLAGYDTSYFIRELGGRIIGGQAKKALVQHSFDLAQVRNEYDSGKMTFVIEATENKIIDSIDDVISFINVRRGII